MLGLDYTARIDPAALLKAGVIVVFRYTTWSGWPKSLTSAEADELHAAGIAVVANFESTADRMRGGAAAGHADATEARGHLGEDHLPADLKIWFSADWDTSAAEVPLVLDYLHAAADVLGGKDKVGCYGGLRVVSAAADAGFAIWQTSAWSYGQWDSRCAARQDGGQAMVGGVAADLNTILDFDALGAWTGDTVSYTISAGWQNDYPDVAGALAAHMPPGTVLDVDHAAGYSAVRSFVAAERAAAIEGKLDQLLARPAAGPAVDPVALAAALGPLLHPSTDVQAFTAALLPHLPTAPDPAAFVNALLSHITVTP